MGHKHDDPHPHHGADDDETRELHDGVSDGLVALEPLDLRSIESNVPNTR